jgi:DNA-binding transcriptional ArsR family regulator
MAQDLSTYFRALADRKRLRVAELLSERESMTVTQLGEELRLSQPLISWHLRILKKAGIITTRREGRQVWCSLNYPVLAEYQEQVADMFGVNESASGVPRTGSKHAITKGA